MDSEAEIRGLFLCFEGIDGSGKTTQARHIARAMRAMGHDVNVTFEPTEGPIGLVLRAHIRHRVLLPVEVEALLFAADRVDHVHNETDGILKTICAGVHVVCDRYLLSSLAYQVPRSPLESVLGFNSGIPIPDLTVFLRRDPSKGLEAKSEHSYYRDSKERPDVLERVALNYERALVQYQEWGRLLVLNVDDHDEISVAETVKSEVFALLSAKTMAQPLSRLPGSGRVVSRASGGKQSNRFRDIAKGRG